MLHIFLKKSMPSLQLSLEWIWICIFLEKKKLFEILPKDDKIVFFCEGEPS